MGRVAIIRDYSNLRMQNDFSETPDLSDSLGDQGQELSRKEEKIPRRIHILGVGNVGTFVAHSLAGIPNPPPLTLLLRRWERLRDFRAQGNALRLTTHNMTEARHGFDVEAPKVPSSESNQSTTMPSAGHSQEFGDGLPMSRANSEKSRPMDQRRVLAESGDTGAETFNNKMHEPGLTSQHHRRTLSSHTLGLHSQYPEPDDMASAADFLNTDENAADSGRSLDHDNREEQSDVIYHLIVTVKAHHTVNALRPYADRLNSQSTIVFLQNGMGMIDEINREVFAYENGRPTYIIGILSHGLYGRGPFDVVHAGKGTIALGLLIDGKDYPPSGRFLMRTMTRTPVFVAVGFAPTDVVQQQLDKLAVNAVINPLTAILDCFNGQLLDNFFVTRIMRLLVAEISIVFRSLPELQNVPNVNMRFDSGRLESLIKRIAQVTGNNRSSMLQDVRDGRQTEIDYINGYIVRRGEELGIHCVTNYMLMQMVRAKGKMNEENLGRVLPLQ